MTVISNYDKDPHAILDFKWDWSEWLEAGETISSYVIAVASGITKESESKTDDSVTVWLSGGTAGSSYIVACKIVTSSSRTDERSMRIMVADR
jgi:hypothetical protein